MAFSRRSIAIELSTDWPSGSSLVPGDWLVWAERWSFGDQH